LFSVLILHKSIFFMDFGMSEELKKDIQVLGRIIAEDPRYKAFVEDSITLRQGKHKAIVDAAGLISDPATKAKVMAFIVSSPTVDTVYADQAIKKLLAGDTTAETAMLKAVDIELRQPYIKGLRIIDTIVSESPASAALFEKHKDVPSTSLFATEHEKITPREIAIQIKNAVDEASKAVIQQRLAASLPVDTAHCVLKLRRN
jgi:hypothetical protein